MNKNQKSRVMGSGLLAGAAALLTLSCADHYDGDESWTPQVQNATLQSPSASDIKVVASPDGSSMTISWPVVYGAGGYAIALYNVNNPNSPQLVKTDTIDGCSVTTSREEDTNYSLTLRTLGNEKYNNQAAAENTEYKFQCLLSAVAALNEGDRGTLDLSIDKRAHLTYD